MPTLKSNAAGPGNLMGGLLDQLKQVKDPRIDRTKRHLLSGHRHLCGDLRSG